MKHLIPFLAAAALGAAAPTARADSILLTEVVTDPQSDHSESAGGNGVPYDAIPGTGTISSVDEFVELFNAGTATVDLHGFALEFVDTTPSTYVFGVTTSGVLRFSDGSSLHALAPGGYVVLGNPSGTLNNRLLILLKSGDGAILDRLDIDDANATSPLDEAVVRLWTGRAFLPETGRGAISPLAPGSPVPEPAPWALLLFSGLSAAAATLRRGCRGRGRTHA